jgi:ABC-type nitrate/sulfonate/bicarbonate transport system permease component
LGRVEAVHVNALRRTGEGLLLVVVVVGAWAAWAELGDVEEVVVPPPIDVARDLVSNPSVYLDALASTLLLAAIGLAGGIACGATMAALAWRSRLLSAVISPTAVFAHSVPIVALIPVVARVLGFNNLTVVVIVVIMSFFPSFVFIGAGLRAVSPASSDLFAVLGATPRQRLWRLAAPSAVPGAVAALRIAATASLIIAVVVESIIGTAGLGRMFMESYLNLRLERAWGVALLIIVLSIAVFGLTSRLEYTVARRFR